MSSARRRTAPSCSPPGTPRDEDLGEREKHHK
jgi:hypothetical protein